MRAVVIAALCATSAASADVAQLDYVHGECTGLAHLTRSPYRSIALSAKVSLATCEARERMRPIALLDSEQSARELEDAVMPSVQILNDVIDAHDPTWTIVAYYQMGELYYGMAQRLLGSIPPLPPNPDSHLVALHDLREQMVRSRVGPWLEQAHADYANATQLARAHPELARDPVIIAAVQGSARRLGGVIATR
jgi:hypothetical protein